MTEAELQAVQDQLRTRYVGRRVHWFEQVSSTNDVARSLAETCRIPSASMSKVTSICGTPRGAGGMPTSWKLPMSLL